MKNTSHQDHNQSVSSNGLSYELSSSVDLCCPHCLNQLQPSSQELLCTACECTFPVVDGIPQLRKNAQAYFGEFRQEEMQELIKDASTGIEPALSQFLRKRQAPPRLGEYIMGAGRAGWKFLLPIHKEARVLDLGCGWGTLAYSFAQSCREVVAVDSTMERMQFLRLRALDGGLNSLTCVCAGDGQFLPFEENSFDIVILNGVLEWVPTGQDGNPRAVQRDFLAEVRRVLRGDGSLYLAIENRYSWKTWFRQPDGHTGLRFVPWLPRRMADIYSRIHKRGPYRNYLYGMRQYSNLLREAGFTTTVFYVPLPGYHHPSQICKATDPKAISEVTSRHEATLAKKVQQSVKGYLTSRFPDSYGIICGRDALQGGFVDRLFKHLHQQFPNQFSAAGQIAMYRINGEMGMVTIVRKSDEQRKPDYIVKLPLHARGEADLRFETDQLIQFHANTEIDRSWQQLLPKALCSGVYEGAYYSVFSKLTGQNGEQYLHAPKLITQAIHQAADFAKQLDGWAKNSNMENAASLKTSIGNKLDAVAGLAPDEPTKQAVEKIGSCISHALSQRIIHPVLGHGDFKLANCLFSNSAELTGVLDWGAGFEDELPLYDFLFMLTDHECKKGQRRLPDVLKDGMQKGTISHFADAQLHRFASSLGYKQDPEWIKTLFKYQWVKRLAPLADRSESKRFDYLYLDDMFRCLGHLDS